MSISTKFIAFLESFSDDQNSVLIESIKRGYTLLEGDESSISAVDRLDALVSGLIRDIGEVTKGHASTHPLMVQYNNGEIDIMDLWVGLIAFYNKRNARSYSIKINRLVLAFVSKLRELVSEQPAFMRKPAKQAYESADLGFKPGSWGRYLDKLRRIFSIEHNAPILP